MMEAFVETKPSRARLAAPSDGDARTRETRRLSTLLEVSQALSGTLNLKASLHRVLEILARHHGAVRGVAASMIAQALKTDGLIEEDKRHLVDENMHLRQELRERYDFSNLVGSSGPMRQIFEQVTQVAGTNTTALIRGESGTGKELIAHAIHYSSLRARKPFVKVSCAALPESLIESELFGYEKGAFTGAETRKKGRFELAEGGTLFLDEIGDVNLATQVKLLRVLQEREFERVGGTETVKANVRLLAATNKDLERPNAHGPLPQDPELPPQLVHDVR